jgi:hypothetical protein
MKQHFCPAEKSTITYQDKCNWCGELENQEPFCYAYKENGEDFFAPKDGYYPADAKPLYTHPPQRTWVGLTDEDEIDWDGGDLKSLIKAIEAKLKEKNT